MMKYRRAAAILLAMLLLLSLAGCGEADESADTAEENMIAADTEVFEMPEETDTLVIYDSPNMTQYLEYAIKLFRIKYPKVEIEFHRFDESQMDASYDTMLNSLLAIGEGPDVICLDMTGGVDPMQIVETGVYADLDPFFEADEDFNMADYNEAAMNAGVRNGKRYAAPLGFTTYLWITTREILEEEGIEIDTDQVMDFEEAIDILRDYKAKYPDRKPVSNTGYGPELLYFAPWNGVKVYDYETKEINLDSEELRLTADAFYELFYKQEYQDVIFNYDTEGGESRYLLNRDSLFIRVDTRSIGQVGKTYSALKYYGTPVVLNHPSFNGKRIGITREMAFIREESPNKLNAYRFLKILLTSPMQGNYHRYGMPVLRKSMDKILNANIHADGGTWKKEDGYIVKYGRLTKEEVEAFKDVVYEIDECLPPGNPTIYLSFALRPYFEGTDSYENCIAAAKDQLMFYAEE